MPDDSAGRIADSDSWKNSLLRIASLHHQFELLRTTNTKVARGCRDMPIRHKIAPEVILLL
jgi:hypothetical protein